MCATHLLSFRYNSWRIPLAHDYPRRRHECGAVTLGLVLSLGGPLLAQTPITLRFHPDPGVRLHTVVTTDGTATIVEQGAPDGSGIALQFRRREALTLRAVRPDPNGVVGEVTHDSVTSRARPAGGLWEGVEAETLPAVTGQAVIGEHFVLQTLLDGVVRTGLIGGFDIALPAGAVDRGSRWETDIGMPVYGRTMVLSELNLGNQFRIDERLVAHAEFLVDSVVPRNADTLVYINVSAQVIPRTMTSAAEASAGSVSASGALGGSLIWSTGWSTFVSGAMRSIIVLRIRYGMPSREDTVVPLEAHMDGTTQFQLRP